MSREINFRQRVLNQEWSDFPFSVATGKIVGLTQRVQFGRNVDVGSGASEDIWRTGGVMVFPTAETTLSVVSTDADDDVLGTGARAVVVEYLDGDYVTKMVEVEMDGTNPVTVATDFFRMQQAYIRYAGSTGIGEGTITFTYTGGVNVGTIPAGRVDIENTQYTVPAGYTAYIVGANVSAGKSSDATVDFQSRDASNGGIFRPADEVIVNEATTNIVLPIYYEVPEKYDIRIQGISTQGTSLVSVSYKMILRDNRWYVSN